MGYNLAGADFRVAVSESHIRVGDLAALLGSFNKLYKDLAVAYLSDSKPFENGQLKAIADAKAVLRVTKISSGSDINLSFVGIDKVLEVVRKIVDDIRFRKERRRQEEEKTKQSKEKTAQERQMTQQMQHENLRRMLDTFKEFKNMSPEDQREFLVLMERSTARLEENPNTLLPQ